MNEAGARPSTIDPYDVAVETAWAAPPTVKARAGVLRAVGRLLDELAPERAVTRIPRPRGPVERHRTPNGCILQASQAAISVSWFPDGSSDPEFGELQVIAWRGVVSRPGSAHRAPGGAAIAGELMLRPVERAVADAVAASEWTWRATDGTVYDGGELAAYCLSVLDRLTAATAGTSQEPA